MEPRLPSLHQPLFGPVAAVALPLLMADRLAQIQAPVTEDIRRFEKFFRQAMSSRVVLLDRIMDYIVKRKGKQIRPLLVFLVGRCLRRHWRAGPTGAPA